MFNAKAGILKSKNQCTATALALEEVGKGPEGEGGGVRRSI